MAYKKSIGIFLLGAFAGAAGFVGVQNTFGPKNNMPVEPIRFDDGLVIRVATPDVPRATDRFNIQYETLKDIRQELERRRENAKRSFSIPITQEQRKQLNDSPEQQILAGSIMTQALGRVCDVFKRGAEQGLKPEDFQWRILVKPRDGKGWDEDKPKAPGQGL